LYNSGSNDFQRRKNSARTVRTKGTTRLKGTKENKENSKKQEDI
jgi:hypothetical protein